MSLRVWDAGRLAAGSRLPWGQNRRHQAGRAERDLEHAHDQMRGGQHREVVRYDIPALGDRLLEQRLLVCLNVPEPRPRSRCLGEVRVDAQDALRDGVRRPFAQPAKRNWPPIRTEPAVRNPCWESSGTAWQCQSLPRRRSCMVVAVALLIAIPSGWRFSARTVEPAALEHVHTGDPKWGATDYPLSDAPDSVS